MRGYETVVDSLDSARMRKEGYWTDSNTDLVIYQPKELFADALDAATETIPRGNAGHALNIDMVSNVYKLAARNFGDKQAAIDFLYDMLKYRVYTEGGVLIFSRVSGDGCIEDLGWL